MKKKILYIGNKLSKHGSTTTSIETLGEFLENEGYEVFYSSSKKNKTLRMLGMIFSTIRYAYKVNFVLIDTYSTQNFWYAFIISQLCRIFKLKYITKLHGGDLPNRVEKSRFFCDLIFNNAYIVSAPSDYLIDSFKKAGYKNVMHIPNTIDLSNYKFTNRELLEPNLLWVRSFSAIYNPKMAIKVLFELQKEYPNASLCMVGPDKDNLILESQNLANELQVNVKFTGRLSKAEWITLAENYSIFINTTHYDNTPVSIIEAMAIGIPIVSTNVGGIPFLIQDKKEAMLVDDNAIADMVIAIKQLINNKQLSKELISNSLKKAQSFDWKIVKLQWFEILK